MSDSKPQVILALPLSGRNAELGLTVQAGVEAFFEQQASSERPTVQIIDTEIIKDQPQSLENCTADVVIGPLLKTDFEWFLNAIPIHVPVLTLNTSPESFNLASQRTRVLWQLALRPEDEAQSLAQAVIDAQRHFGVTLSLNNEWSTRSRLAFKSALESLQGSVLVERSIDPDRDDLTRVLKEVLGMEQSLHRKEAIAHITGLKLLSNPKPNDQIAFIFYSGPALLGTQLRQQCRYLYADSIPMLCVSDIYSDNPLANADLSGVYFTDMPWMIQSAGWIQKKRKMLQNSRFNSFINKRLFAMGLDAAQVGMECLNAARLGLKTPYRTQLFNGVTGQLTLSAQGVLTRQTELAVFLEDGSISGVREIS